ncbi:hypothetical protein PNF30_16240 [Bacillus safensis]|uniref:hypothetical protein n=1 Tax=Bacillus TaxID=1386 RepID=UPI002342D908|nr:MULTISPECIES: hypothetical protein [Bacillus]MEC3814160.1 hypothetical protein [Bacillus altitudinis]WCL57028.1 hypothetical protein PNF30_16240 [Bacillus safensis]
MRTNMEIRKAIENSGIFTWQIAKQLGVHENTFYRWMREEITGERREKVLAAIKDIEEKKE